MSKHSSFRRPAPPLAPRPLLAAALLTLLVATPLALAQSTTSTKNQPLVAPIAQTRGSPDAQVLVQITAIALGFAILAINFLPSKRGHQD